MELNLTQKLAENILLNHLLQLHTLQFISGEFITKPTSAILNKIKSINCSPDHWSDIYHTAYNCEIFLFPLLIIVATYIRIYTLLTRSSASMFQKSNTAVQ